MYWVIPKRELNKEQTKAIIKYGSNVKPER
jgi:hypothetical protein